MSRRERTGAYTLHHPVTMGECFSQEDIIPFPHAKEILSQSPRLHSHTLFYHTYTSERCLRLTARINSSPSAGTRLHCCRAKPCQAALTCKYAHVYARKHVQSPPPPLSLSKVSVFFGGDTAKLRTRAHTKPDMAGVLSRLR